MPLTDVITRFSTAAVDGNGSGTYNVTRHTGGGYGSNGVALATTVTSLQLDACVMSLASGSDLLVLPEGTHRSDVRIVVTSWEPKIMPYPDHITIAGEDFMFFHVDGPYNVSGIVAYKAYASRQVIP